MWAAAKSGGHRKRGYRMIRNLKPPGGMERGISAVCRHRGALPSRRPAALESPDLRGPAGATPRRIDAAGWCAASGQRARRFARSADFFRGGRAPRRRADDLRARTHRLRSARSASNWRRRATCSRPASRCRSCFGRFLRAVKRTPTSQRSPIQRLMQTADRDVLLRTARRCRRFLGCIRRRRWCGVSRCGGSG